MMGRNFRDSLRHFRRETGGNFAVLSAITLPVLILAIGAAVSYSNTVTLKEQTQAATDAASLAATTAYANGTVTTAAAAEAIATQFFTADAPAAALSGQTALSVVTTVPTTSGQGTVSTVVSYSGRTNAMFSNLLGGSGMNFNVASTTQATVSVTSQTGQGNISGAAQVWGDPHVANNNGFDGYFDCPTGSWYSTLSDYNIQVNVSCQPFYLGEFGLSAQYISEIAMVLGGHKILINGGVVNCNTYDGCAYSADAWIGAIQIDGVVTPAPTKSGTYTVLSDTTQNISIVEIISAPGQIANWGNGIWVYTPNYNMFIDFSDYDSGQIQVYAQDNAGACGTPGGFLGQTYGKGSDMTDTDFYESSMFGLNSQYSATCNMVSTTMLKSSHITQ